MVKKVKIFKKVIRRVENLKIEAYYFFRNRILEKPLKTIFNKFLFCFVTNTCNLRLYLVLLVFLRVFDQTFATKVEIYLCFLFFIHR